MKPEIKEAWVKALRSGEYQQGKEALRIEDQYCCLGVLCDIHRKQEQLSNQEDWKLVENGFTYIYNGSRETLPRIVTKWAGLEDDDPWFYNEKKFRTDPLSVLNDEGYTFDDIADLIEKHF
jgi:hypothetical protein